MQHMFISKICVFRATKNFGWSTTLAPFLLVPFWENKKTTVMKKMPSSTRWFKAVTFWAFEGHHFTTAKKVIILPSSRCQRCPKYHPQKGRFDGCVLVYFPLKSAPFASRNWRNIFLTNLGDLWWKNPSNKIRHRICMQLVCFPPHLR